jgi:2'-5' RNA ligase superfamily protein
VLTGLVLAVPVLEEFVERHRHPSDASASLGVPAHVTALYPWVRQPLTDDVLDRCARVVQGFGPVSMSFRQVATFPVGVVYLVPEPEGRLRELTRLLVKAYPDCVPYDGEHPDPQPHLTVTTGPAEELGDLAVQAARDLIPTDCTVRALTALEQQPDGRWLVVRTLSLEG